MLVLHCNKGNGPWRESGCQALRGTVGKKIERRETTRENISGVIVKLAFLLSITYSISFSLVSNLSSGQMVHGQTKVLNGKYCTLNLAALT